MMQMKEGIFEERLYKSHFSVGLLSVNKTSPSVMMGLNKCMNHYFFRLQA